MEILHSEIQKSLVLTFKRKITSYDGYVKVIPEEYGYIAIGILRGDHFLDIKRNQVYEVLCPNEDGVVSYVPEIGEPYVYTVDDYTFKSKREQKELLIQARKMLAIYEETENIVCFGKEKIKYRYQQSYKRKK